MESGLEQRVRDALLAYWTSREDAAARQALRGSADVGGRAGATSGGHLDQVASLLAGIAMDAGAPAEAVWYNAPAGDPNRRRNAAKGYTLPGYYRPTKQWDLVVYHEDSPIIVVELKSQNGPSYGNNANNRAEEALGSAIDFARARAAGLVPGNPWLGYVFVIEDDAFSQRVEGGREHSHYAKDVIFTGWSYIDRVRLLSQRLVEEGHYDAAWAVATSRPDCPGTKDPNKCPQLRSSEFEHSHRFGWWEPDSDLLGYEQFAYAMASRIRKHYVDP